MSVSAAKSTLTFFVNTKINAVHGKATGLTGYVEAAWNADGSIVVEQDPRMHVEFLVEQMRSGNDFKDRAMWKIIDSKRFPKIAADLLSIRHGAKTTTYTATGRITLAGIARTYDGVFIVKREDSAVTVSGYLDVDVRDFGLKEQSMFTLSVEPVVKIHLHMHASATS